jgi:hypothetical protein
MTTLTTLCDTIAVWLTVDEPQNPHWSPETWETFKLVCRVHGVTQLLYERLEKRDWLEPAIKVWLAEQFEANVQRLTTMQGELEAILALFAERQLPLMPLKGSILAATVYEQAGLRPMADLDLLIHPEDFAQATTLLKDLGYEQAVVHWKHTEFIKPDNRQVVSTTSEHPDNPRGLEVHRHCRETFGGPTVDLTALMWQHSRPGLLLNQPTQLPQAEVLWLHLLVHATYHLWQGKGRLIHLVDLAYLTPRLPNLSPFLTQVEARFTYPTLALLHKYFPGVVDSELLAILQTQVSPAFQRWVAGLNLVNTSYLNPQATGLYLLKALKFSEGRPGEVIRALRFAFLPDLTEISLDHPHLATSKLPWLAYFLLPWDWVKRLVR